MKVFRKIIMLPDDAGCEKAEITWGSASVESVEAIIQVAELCK